MDKKGITFFADSTHPASTAFLSSATDEKPAGPAFKTNLSTRRFAPFEEFWIKKDHLSLIKIPNFPALYLRWCIFKNPYQGLDIKNWKKKKNQKNPIKIETKTIINK